MEISKKAKWMASASVVLTLSAMAGQVGTARIGRHGFGHHVQPQLLHHVAAQVHHRQGLRWHWRHPARHGLLDPLCRVRRPVPDRGHEGRRPHARLEISVVNAHGSDATEFADAQADITKGDKVLIMDPLDSGVGSKIESYAAAHGVKVIDYDRLTLGGSRTYYDSFNNNFVGTLLGQGLVSCIASEHVSKPVVLVMHGAVTDNNATLFADGYDAVLQPYFSSGKWTLVGKLQPNEVPAGTWTPSVALTEFEQEYTAHSNINAVLMPNDENGAPIITYLKSKGIKANTFPVTGQDATLTGLGNVLTGYQCGTVYKPIYLEAQAAVALAVYSRAGMTPPAALVNGTTTDSVEHKYVPSVLLTPEWVTKKNMNSTVIADKFVPPKQLCAAPYASAAACKAAGINP